MAYSVEKLGSRKRSENSGEPLQSSAKVRHEGTPSRRTRLLMNSSVSLGPHQARIDASTLTLQQGHIAANLQCFNRIGR
jgi:hypothetical protein